MGFSKPVKASMMNESKIVNELEQDKNIRYFRMPENNGWNSGRALLISQVQTEYFVSCDDDFYFHDKFNLEIMLGIRDPRSRLYFNKKLHRLEQATRMKLFVDPCSTLSKILVLILLVVLRVNPCTLDWVTVGQMIG